MIVAAYLNNISWAPIHPVYRIERINPIGSSLNQSKQQQNPFAYLLATAMEMDGEESNGFDSKA